MEIKITASVKLKNRKIIRYIIYAPNTYDASQINPGMIR